MKHDGGEKKIRERNDEGRGVGITDDPLGRGNRGAQWANVAKATCYQVQQLGECVESTYDIIPKTQLNPHIGSKGVFYKHILTSVGLDNLTLPYDERRDNDDNARKWNSTPQLGSIPIWNSDIIIIYHE